MDSILVDAQRYRWLRSRKSLNLTTLGTTWTRTKDGSKFIGTHLLCAEGVHYGTEESLDKLIDFAIKEST